MEALKQKRRYLTAAAVSLLGIAALCYYYFLTPAANSEQTQYLYIDEDDTPDSVCAKLNVVLNGHAMTALSTLLRHQSGEQGVRTGRYAVLPDDNAIDLFRRLRNGQQAPIMLTIPESKTMPRLAGALAKRLMADSLTLIKALSDAEELRQLGYDTCTIACMLVPNTYEVYWNIGARQLLSRLKKEHDAFWNYERLHKAKAIGLTPDEVCTLASIIDEETANTAEKPMIAGMYLNRLKQKMPLQADPTVKFALQDFTIRRIYKGMLTTDSPYNTYKYAGLPPGPIKIASIKGIDAVLNRVAHDYLFMCAKEDFSGTHNFARTYQEHQQNAARYSRALNERGIK